MLKKIELSLEQHQSILYDILYMVDDFCKAHDIPYFLVAGSVLGAVRHQGIIPWDDDIDIGMTRDNYEKFVEQFSKNVPEGYEVYDFYNTRWFDAPFIKIAKKNTVLKETFFYHGRLGINIDVFPYDGCGCGKKNAEKFFQSVNSEIISKSQCFGSNPKYTCTHWKSKLIYFTTIYPLLFVPKIKKKYLDRIYRRAKKYSISQSEYCALIVNGLYGSGEVQPIHFVQDLTMMQFGSRNIPVPAAWDQYLKDIYGDYMTPPPKDKRKRHSSTPACVIENV